MQDFVMEFSKIIPSGNKIDVGYFKNMIKIAASAIINLIDEQYRETQNTGKFEKLRIKISQNQIVES